MHEYECETKASAVRARRTFCRACLAVSSCDIYETFVHCTAVEEYSYEYLPRLLCGPVLSRYVPMRGVGRTVIAVWRRVH